MKKNVSVDLCQGDGCICFQISKKRNVMPIAIFTDGYNPQINSIFVGPPPPTTPGSMARIRQMLAEDVRTVEQQRQLWEGRHR